MKWLTTPHLLIAAAAVAAVYYNGRSRFVAVCKANSMNPGNCDALLARANTWDLFLFGLGVKKGGPASVVQPDGSTPPEIVFE